MSVGAHSFHTQTRSNFTLPQTQLQRREDGYSATVVTSLHRQIIHRTFAAAFDPNAVFQKEPGHVTKKLRVLNMDVVKQILAELRAVDTNSDGRYVFIQQERP
jgi:hypothetical protein